jgi:CBS-domain-containing membrane protein
MALSVLPVTATKNTQAAIRTWMGIALTARIDALAETNTPRVELLSSPDSACRVLLGGGFL